MKLRQKIINTFAILLTFAFFLFAIFFKIHPISAGSMSPGISEGSYVIVTKWGFGEFVKLGMPKTKIKRGYIFVFTHPKSNVLILKRVIGLPGDEIEINNHYIFVNRKKVQTEPVSISNNLSIELETIENKSYLVQKNLERTYLHTSKTKVGKNQFYVVGDNRDNSADSRLWGTIPIESFRGKLVYVIKRSDE